MIPFKLTPEYREYVWGGTRLRPNEKITAEAWIVYEKNKILDGPFAGLTLQEVADANPIALMGKTVVKKTGNRFPLLIKLLDCADWLSLQVHPNNEQAIQLEGPGNLGKTEAWYVVEADEGAQLLGGFEHSVTSDDIVVSLKNGTIIELVQRHNVCSGDSIFIPAGLIHALGPGLLIYEVQQTSDITYRVYDWNRPLTADRRLHLEEANVALNPDLKGELIPSSTFTGEQKANLVISDYFSLELISGDFGTASFDTSGNSFSAFTVLEGETFLWGNGWQFKLERFESLLIPAVCGRFQVEWGETGRALRAHVP